MDDYIIRLSNAGGFRETEWNMIIDLKAVADQAGKRVKDEYNGGMFVDYPVPRAKKLLKLILEYGSEEDLQACDKYLAINQKLYSWWKEVRSV